MKIVLLILTLVLTSAPALGKLDQSLEEIEKLIRLRDYSQAVSRLQIMAEKGDPEAQYRLAGLYRAGKGVSKDLDKATDLYHESAQGGHADAQYAIALIIEKSNDSAASRNEARRWYKKSAAQGNQRASIKLEQFQQAPQVTPRRINRKDLFNAIQHNDEALINSLISNDVDLNLTDRQGNSTVMAALLAGWPRLAGTLIPKTQHLGQANIYGDSPLHVASSRGYKGIVKALLDSNVGIDQTDYRGDTALMLALKNRHAEIAELLLERGADYELTNKKNRSAVDFAFADDNPASKALFAQFGIKPKVVTRKKAPNSLETFKSSVDKYGARYAGWPLLNIAIELGDDSISNQLIARKPDLNAADPDGNSALHVAARKGDSVTLKQLIRNGVSKNGLNRRKETALYLSVESACLKCVRLLLGYKADPSIATKFEVTPLEAAIRNNQAKIAQALLQNKSNYPGIHRVLLLAIQKKMENLSSVLIKRDKHLDSVDEKKRSALWHSADQGLEKTTALLIASGEIDVNRKDINGHSALAQAVIHGHFKLVRLLIEHGADPTTRTQEGNTLVMLAVLSQSPEIVEFLLNRGIEMGVRDIDLNARDNVGETALMMAAATAQDQVIEVLLHAGADPQLRNNEDLNAFQIATNAGHRDTARFIHDKSNFVFKLFN
ncbi:MAG: ankyrin repeat domain-containing protein [Gammaproteobacteria bacterium]|nr:ankyrin repeat domain-containing protein [Gammaproteobacteria bacterium]